MFIAKVIRIHIINILKCSGDPYISNTPALNEVKTLDYITRHVQLPHIHPTNFANEIDVNGTNSTGSGRRIRGRGRGSRFTRGTRVTTRLH
jgi:hypothetical protein